MKRVFCFFFVFVLAVSLCSCGLFEKKDADQTGVEEKEESALQTPSESAVTDEIKDPEGVTSGEEIEQETATEAFDETKTPADILTDIFPGGAISQGGGGASSGGGGGGDSSTGGSESPAQNPGIAPVDISELEPDMIE